MTTAVAPEALRELGSTESREETLALLTTAQRTRRLLLFRVLLDALAATSADMLPLADQALATEHTQLLEAADQAGSQAARRVLFYPFAGTWAEHCVRLLDQPAGPQTTRDLSHLGSVAAAAALRSGMSFRTRVPVHGGRVALPTLGALRSDSPEGSAAELRGGEGRLVISTVGRPPVEIRRDGKEDWRSSDPGWLPLHTLPGGPRPVFLDDLDPCRSLGGEGIAGLPWHGGGRGTGALDPEQRARWGELWREALPLLGLGGASRSSELSLLDCIVPLPGTAGGIHSSGTRPEAFGAVLASPPPSPALLAAGLTHELQHAKLAALSELVTLHTAGPERRYWAPWRPDPRPFDGLLHGTYAHLALAVLWQRLARRLPDAVGRGDAWAAHARCWTQAGAVLPVLRGSHRLTGSGHSFVQAMSERHEQLRRHPPPDGYLVRAAAYVDTARALWRRQHS